MKRVKATVLIVALSIIIGMGNSKPAKSFPGELDYYYIMMMFAFAWFADCDEEGDLLGCDPVSYAEIKGDGAQFESVDYIITPFLPITRDLALGFYIGAGKTDFVWAEFENTKVDTDSRYYGGYFAWRPLKDTQFTVSGLYADQDNDLSGFDTTATYDSSTWIVNFDLVRFYHFGNKYLKPAVGVSYGQSEYDEFRDDEFDELTPSNTVDLASFSTSLEAGYNFECPGFGSLKDGYAAAPRASCGRVFGMVGGSLNLIDGLDDTDDRVPEPDEQYFSFKGSVGTSVPLMDHVDAGAKASAFTGGDISGYNVQGYIAVDLWGLAGYGPALEGSPAR